MKDDDRRRFLKQLAKTAIYTAPVIRTFALPADLLGQGQSSQHMHTKSAPAPASVAEPAPWDKPPPGSVKP